MSYTPEPLHPTAFNSGPLPAHQGEMIPNLILDCKDVAIIIDDMEKQKQNKDRQDQEKEEKEDKEKGKKKQESRSAFLIRRIFIGKNKQEEDEEEKKKPRLNKLKKELRRHMAEFIGSFFLVFFIAGIQMSSSFSDRSPVNNVDKGLVAGFILTGLIYSFGKVSGAHFNPCVTAAFALRGAFGFIRTITYIITQFAGVVVAAAILHGLFGGVDGVGTTVPAPNLPNRNAFGVEILITFILITVILTTAENAQILGPTSALAVGSTFGALELFAWNFTGASANPWRTIGPTLISNYGWSTYWVYIIGPIVGTLLAVLLQRLLVTGIDHDDRKDAGKGEGKNADKDD